MSYEVERYKCDQAAAALDDIAKQLRLDHCTDSEAIRAMLSRCERYRKALETIAVGYNQHHAEVAGCREIAREALKEE